MGIGCVNWGYGFQQKPILTKTEKDNNLKTAVEISKQLSGDSVPPQFERTNGVTNYEILSHANILLDRGVDEFQVKTLAGLNEEEFATAEKLLDIGIDTIYVRDMAKDADPYQVKYMNGQIQKAQDSMASYNQALLNLNEHGRELYKTHFNY